jgi:hypothetical protein
VIDMADHRSQLKWFRSQINPPPNAGAGPEVPQAPVPDVAPPRRDGTTPVRNTGPPTAAGAAPPDEVRAAELEVPERPSRDVLLGHVDEWRSHLPGGGRRRR